MLGMARKGAVVRKLKAGYPEPLDNNINLLLGMQEKKGYLPREEMIAACKSRGIPGVDLNGVATFYSKFRFHQKGKYVISLCKGTACHVKGAEKLEEYVYDILKIRNGETTSDGRFSLQCVNCVGACSRAPNVMINDTVYGEMTQKKLKKMLDGLP
jgi:NADH-quinone oxidoreductase subunit E